MLRQVLMCSADLHIISYDWVEELDYPWPDFSVSHNCRDYQKVHEWGRQHTVKTNNVGGLTTRPADAVLRKLPINGDS
jgi:Mycotoxin biosynthesis protein UstYa